MSHKSAPPAIRTIGIDLGNNSFHLIGLDQTPLHHVTAILRPALDDPKWPLTKPFVSELRAAALPSGSNSWSSMSAATAKSRPPTPWGICDKQTGNGQVQIHA